MKKPHAPDIRTVLSPPDFYRFKHTTWVRRPHGQKSAWHSPYWIVGISPFDPATSPDQGHIVHLGTPRFVARWTMNEECFHDGKDQRTFFDDDLGLLIYEISLLDEFTADLETWLHEAACAIAYSKGNIVRMLEADEEH